MNRFDKPFRILPSIDIKKNLELFRIASSLDTHELLQYSLINQVPLDAVNEDGECLIHEVINIDQKKASEHAKLNVIKFLVQNKVNPDKPNKYNQTPLHLACGLQNELIVSYLLSLGVNSNYQDNTGLTPFHYLLTGRIKTIDNTSEVLDFVPPPKKQDLKSNEKILEIKKQLWEIISSAVIKNDLPMLETIQNTLDNIITEDREIIQRQNETKVLIAKLAGQPTSGDKLPEIKQNIELTRKVISDKIVKLFNGLVDLDNFKIHDKQDSSWTPLNKKQGLIVDGKIKKVIKSDMNSIGERIKILNREFKTYNIIPDNYYDDGFNDMFVNYVFNNKKINFKKNGNVMYFDETAVFDPEFYKESNKKIKHKFAVDNASSIINFSKLKYAGGPRNVEVIRPANIWTELTTLLDPAIFPDETLQIMYLLGSPLQQGTITGFGRDFNPLTNIAAFNAAILGDIQNNANWIDRTTRLIDPAYLAANLPFVKDQIIDIKFYIVMALTAIQNPYDFVQIKNINVPGAGAPNYDELIYANCEFAKKWYQIYVEGCNLSSWLYGMWCDIMCKFSDSNLDCAVPFRLLMLMSGLQNFKTNKIQGIINSYKPHLIQELFARPDSDQIKITKWMIILLNDNVTKQLLDDVVGSIDNDLTFLPRLNLNSELFNIVTLFYNRLLPAPFDPSTLGPNVNNYYESYNNPVAKSDDVICKIILSYCNNLNNKPLKQTILDTIYFIKKYDSGIPATITNFQNISGLHLFGGLVPIVVPPINITDNIQPSFYGILNYELDGPSEINSFHLLVAHLLGLHYEGMVYKTPYENLTGLFKNSSNEYAISVVLARGPPPAIRSVNYHILNPAVPNLDKLIAGRLPLILNFIYLNHNDANPINNPVIAPRGGVIPPGRILSPKSKYHFYNIYKRELRIPTYQAYAMLLISRIKHYQSLIKKDINSRKGISGIVDEILSGKTSDLKDLYTQVYPRLVANNKLLESVIDSFNDLNMLYQNDKVWESLNIYQTYKNPIKYDFITLAKLLNKINSNYYLYYYLYSPNQLINLSRFNYYQIPINNPKPYYYYEGPGQLTNIMDIDANPVPVPGVEVMHDESIDRPGFINNFSLSNYDKQLIEYSNNNFITSYITNATDFKRLKTSKLPPSLTNALDDFYKFALIELVIKLIEYIETNKNGLTKDLYDKSQSYIKSMGISIGEYDLSTYLFISKIIQELIKEQVKIYINNSVIIYFEKFIREKYAGLPGLPTTQLLTTKEMDINLKQTKIDITNIVASSELRNIYSLVIQPVKGESDIFVLYPNNLTNVSKLRSKYGVSVNANIINKLLEHQSSPYIVNSEGASPIYPIIKNYNYILIEKLKKLGLDFRYFDGESPIKFIEKENNNNLDKILGLYKEGDNICNLFCNIDNYLYNDIKSLIISNDVYGNNVLLNLPESFNLSTYLTLQFLSEYLLNTNTKFTINDLIEILKIKNINIDDINKNYLGENLALLNVPSDINNLISEEIVNEKKKERTELLKEFDLLDKTINHLQQDPTNVKNMALANKIRNSENYTSLNNSIQSLLAQINNVDAINSVIPVTYLPSHNVVEDDIMKRYLSLNNVAQQPGLIMSAWVKLFNKPINQPNQQNYNLIPIYLLEKQKELINNFNPNNLSELELIEKSMEHLSSISEYYFKKSKYTDDNNVLKFIKSMLYYNTQLVIGHGIELMIRRILLTYLTNALPNFDLIDINNRIKFILEEELIGQTDKDGNSTTLLKLLYDEICPNLVLNSVDIYSNKSEEQAHNPQSIKEILLNYFQLFENSPIKLPDEIKVIFKKDVTNYFDTFVSQTILLWYVNSENIFKFFINNFRCLETFIKLITP